MAAEPQFAEVVIPVPLRRTFTYRIPPPLLGKVVPGAAVTVPFGRRHAQGFVVGVSRSSEYPDLKDVKETGERVFSDELLALTRWVSQYYICSWGEVLKAALPGGMEPTARRRKAAAKPRRRKAGEMAPADDAGGVDGAAGVADDAGGADGAAGPLVPAGGRGDPLAGRITLNEMQAQALAPIRDTIAAGVHRTYLLHGVTGSGKTEIYLAAADLVDRAGGQTLFLVPEIVLSSQLLSLCRDRYGDRVVVWHSQLPPGARKEAWRRVNDGTARIVVGARSAVFAPFRKLSLVVVDEEHESAYKQDESPRYNGRDVAIYRAALAKAAIVLGSATPSLESFHNAISGKYVLLELAARVDDRPRPSVELVDLGARRGGEDDGERRKQPKEHRPDDPLKSRILSDALVDAIRERLEKREQTIVFLNRRGHSTVVRCGDCGHVARCPHCDISLTWHADRLELCCHYCAFRQRQFDLCPDCGGARFVYKGAGTQKVEAEIARLIPEARYLRLDFDSTRRRGSLDRIIDQFRKRDADILLGTQMVARGLDFPFVTLVGVINADTQLNLPDFRSAERTFQLLTQVAGRAGRGQVPGHVMIQTFSPGHYAVELSSRQDYRAFFDIEIQFRREVGYPPLTRMVNLLFDGRSEDHVEARAGKVAETLNELIQRESLKVDLLGPAPQSLSRLKGKYRWHVTLKAKDHRLLRKLGQAALEESVTGPGQVRLSVDVDPASLL